MIWALAAICAGAAVPAGLRWLRVAQREHYLAPSVTRFALRWWGNGAANQLLTVLSWTGLIGSLWLSWLGLLVVAAQIGPIGLSIRGKTSRLASTGRLRRLAAVSGTVMGALMVVGAVVDSAFLVVCGLMFLPVIVDLGQLVMTPIERRLGDRWVRQAETRLKSSGAKVVAITGSFGKTTTKQYVTHLLSGSHRTVASPASFNNRMGLARAVNEHLVPGTEVFVAEMGTYGRGEIAELCSWMRPTISAIVAVGPVHLERFKTEERIVSAKAEILDRAEVGVISVDHPLLADLARDRGRAMRVITVSGEGAEARVTIREGSLHVDDVEIGAIPPHVFPVNLAVAVGVGLAHGLAPIDMIGRLGDLPRAEHRQTVSTSERGFSIVDDTFNSNPAGARSGLRHLAEIGAGGRTVVVTPGMVELGSRQFEENRSFAAEASSEVDHVVVVGSTNRRALLEGSGNGSASVTVVASRQEAVDWVRENLGPGDAVLYENDLPDHYP